MLVATPPAMAAQIWYVLSEDGSRCENSVQFSAELTEMGLPPAYSPAQFIDLLKTHGIGAEVKIRRVSNAVEYVLVSWKANEGIKFRVFTEDPSYCQRVVNDLIKNGKAPAPGELE
jgi:hypothetical protein